MYADIEIAGVNARYYAERNDRIIKFIEEQDIQKNLLDTLFLGLEADNWSPASRYAPLVRKKLKHMNSCLQDSMDALSAPGRYILLQHICPGATGDARKIRNVA